jgi:pyridoxamine 5'-phosphate oxidase
MSDESFRTELRNTKVLEGPFPPLDFTTFPPTPQEAFKNWFHEAITAGVREPHAMTVSTVDEEGCPDARVLILKNVDSRGWHFAIKADSPKGKQLAANGAAALTFYWPLLARQVRVRGVAVALPAQESVADYRARPVASKISAVASEQSDVLLDKMDLETRLVDTEEALKMNPMAGVEKWRVYAVDAGAVEFWQGDSSRLHQRLRYVWSKDDCQWVKQLLWP